VTRGTLLWAEAREKCAAAHNKYTSVLRHTKALHWKDWLKVIMEDDIWKEGWMAQSQLSDGSTTRIPTLVDRALDGTVTWKYTTVVEEQEVFIWIFFPPRPAPLPTYPGDEGPLPSPISFHMPPVNLIRKVILKTHLHKALGPDKIPNIVLCKVIDVLAPILHSCLNAIITINYYPRACQNWATIVLQKPGCPDYTIAKAY